MDEQITQLDRRLTSVEVEVASLAAESAAARSQYATKEDLAKVEARLIVIQSNYVTKEDLAALDNKLSGKIASLDGKVSADIAAMDSKQSAELSALRLQVAELELRMVRWLVATTIATSGVVIAAIKAWP
ncbi:MULTISPECIES: hypothetical protein [unclassified Duganella]|uniref:hypothetical protein n=1 Tax=unclassified Duganella TaxID=2636909 RepID=UPI0008739845|nr:MULTISPECIES: hypothetical protein [unclassified Duganella]OEZ54644.1 hypothetical protein DUGA6_57390 [Duganella sp. HH105]OFA00284.1 hypothetical protein DUGA2_48240 [Duganella sp. HH101]